MTDPRTMTQKLADNGRKGKTVSPWAKGPMASGPKAKQSYINYKRRGKSHGNGIR